MADDGSRCFNAGIRIQTRLSQVKTFLIAPVRGYPSDTHAAIVKKLESEGYEVHWPARDTNQNDDPTGLRICTDNAAAIGSADIVHVVWDGKSQGVLFDLGVAFALGKMVIPVNLPPETVERSFGNLVRAWTRR